MVLQSEINTQNANNLLMRGRYHSILIFAILLFFSGTVCAQDSSRSFIDRIISLPDKVFAKVDRQSQKLEQKLVSQTDKYLQKLEHQELKLKRKLWKTDSLKAKEVFGDVEGRYKALRETLHTTTAQAQQTASVYSGHADSLTTAIRFINEHPLLKQSEAISSKINTNLQSVTQLQSSFNKTEYIRQRIKQQQEVLKQQLQNTPLAKQFQKYKKQVYYYQQQVKAYRETLNDPELLGSKLVDAAKKIPAFDAFFRQHSELASLFRLPGNTATPNSTGNFGGLQTRAQVGQMIQQQFAGTNINPQQYIQQNLGAAQAQINQLKQKVRQFGGSNSSDEMPDFKPNDQKVKSFLKRLEFGSNLQTTSARNYFPATTDIALSAGYKLNDKSIVGFGASYKLGLGTGFDNIRLSHQGVSIRSFIDWKVKGNFWISGGYEQNYLAVFRRIQDLNNPTIWKQSALLGMSKSFEIKSRFFKKTKLQVLYDFLWRQQLPVTQPVLFRVGYNF